MHLDDVRTKWMRLGNFWKALSSVCETGAKKREGFCRLIFPRSELTVSTRRKWETLKHNHRSSSWNKSDSYLLIVCRISIGKDFYLQTRCQCGSIFSMFSLFSISSTLLISLIQIVFHYNTLTNLTPTRMLTQIAHDFFFCFSLHYRRLHFWIDIPKQPWQM